MSVSHKTIKRFYLDGEIYDESFIPRMKDQYIAMIRSSMQSKGYVIRYDIDPDFTVSYNGKTFEFKLSVYGVYVGRKRAEWISGIDKNTIISNTTHQNKLSGYYSPVV